MANSATQNMVLMVVREFGRKGGGVSASTCAKNLGISEGTARTYLNGLVSSGHIRARKNGARKLYTA